MPMPYDLTIDRVGTLVPSSTRSNSPNLSDVDEIAATFREQGERLHKELSKASSEILDAAKAGSSQAEWVKRSNDDFDDDDQFVDIVAKDSLRDGVPLDQSVAPLLALMPSRRLRLSLSNMWWTVRTRATVTSCALQKTSEPTKLWWTFEGIPQDSKKPASGRDAAAFLSLSRSMSRIAMPLLNKAYWTAFQAVTHRAPSGFPEPRAMVRVCMADADTREMAALIDAFARKVSPSTIRKSSDPSSADARLAMTQLDAFVGEVTKKDAGWVPPEESFYLSDSLRGARGVLSRQVNELNGPMIIGFARRLGSRVSSARLPDDLRAPTRTEYYLRAISAARPLSARIAEDEAKQLGAPKKGRGLHSLTA